MLLEKVIVYITVKEKKTVQPIPERSIINQMEGLEEAKKRNKKIPITEVAIQKVRKVSVPGFTEAQNANLLNEHRRLLEYALRRNNSNEVMGITSLDFDGTLYGLGTEEFVAMTPQMESYRLHLSNGSGIIIHNHPATRTFSMMDLGYFISKPQIGIITIVSNQGNVHILSKQAGFNRANCIGYLLQLRTKYNDDFDTIVKEFLKTCGKVGIVYVRS